MQTEEKDFQTQANEAGQRAAEWMREQLDRLHDAQEGDDPGNDFGASNEIAETPLSVEVRSGWYTAGASDADRTPAEYCILLSTGGPATRIVGDLEDGQPTTARFEYQDWFKPWTEARLDEAQRATVLEYAQQFYFGE
jgi:hypothetical protein